MRLFNEAFHIAVSRIIFGFCSIKSIYTFFAVYVNEEGNELADRAIEVAMTYIKKNNKLGINVELKRVIGNRTDSNNLLESRE